MLLGNKPGRIPAVLSMLSQSVPGECWANSDRRFCFVLFLLCSREVHKNISVEALLLGFIVWWSFLILLVLSAFSLEWKMFAFLCRH